MFSKYNVIVYVQLYFYKSTLFFLTIIFLTNIIFFDFLIYHLLTRRAMSTKNDVTEDSSVSSSVYGASHEDSDGQELDAH